MAGVCPYLTQNCVKTTQHFLECKTSTLCPRPCQHEMAFAYFTPLMCCISELKTTFKYISGEK